MVFYVMDIFRWYFTNLMIFPCYETNFLFILLKKEHNPMVSQLSYKIYV
jgi:hypothetical protein